LIFLVLLCTNLSFNLSLVINSFIVDISIDYKLFTNIYEIKASILLQRNELWFRFSDSAAEIISTTIDSHVLIKFINKSFYCWFFRALFKICAFNFCSYLDRSLLFYSMLINFAVSYPLRLFYRIFWINYSHSGFIFLFVSVYFISLRRAINSSFCFWTG
jgi:hypothetical protein